MQAALGMIEAIGLTTAMTALDAASKTADVKLMGYDRVIGVDTVISITLHLAGEVAAVQAAVDAGVAAGQRVGKVVAWKVIPRPHEEVDKILAKYEKSFLPAGTEEAPARSRAAKKADGKVTEA